MIIKFFKIKREAPTNYVVIYSKVVVDVWHVHLVRFEEGQDLC